ncbi:hypothetical protein ACA910_002025 [Epithemia clementina (nom. ined.)]
MKTLKLGVLASTLLPALTSGFSVGHRQSNVGCVASSTAALQATATRRELFLATVAGASSALVLGRPSVARASSNEIDYSRIQDLLGSDASSSSSSYSPSVPTPGKRPTYLTEPTEEFKQNEAKATEFKRQNLKAKQDFRALLDRFETVPNGDEEALAGSLDDMRRFVRRNGGLPLGIPKQEVISTIRRRKNMNKKVYWPTNVEIAYQDLLLEIQYQQSPNTEKDSENPL